MSKNSSVSTSSTAEHGGGTIKRHTAWALLLTVCMTALMIPSSVGTENHIASDNNAKIGLKETLKHEMFGGAKIHGILSDKNVLEAVENLRFSGSKSSILKVNAASKTKKVNAKTKSSKKVKASGKTSKKVKAAKHRVFKASNSKNLKAKKSSSNKSKRVKAANRYRKTTYKSYSSSSGSWSDDPVLDTIMRSGSKYGYRRGIITAAAMQSAGAGDCWAMSEYLHGKFQEAGYQSRVIQYRTRYSSRHRSVQVNRNGEWQTAPYRSYGYNYLFV